MKHPVGPASVGYTSGPPEHQITLQVGHDDLFGALEVKLSYTNLIINFLLMQ